MKVPERKAKKRREIKVKFGAGGLTVQGGLSLVEELVHRLRVKEIIKETIYLGFAPTRGSGYREDRSGAGRHSMSLNSLKKLV